MRPAVPSVRTTAAGASGLAHRLGSHAASVLARFWADALRWELDAPAQDGIGLVPTDGTRFRIHFLPVLGEKAGQNRIHLDLTSRSDDDQAESAGG